MYLRENYNTKIPLLIKKMLYPMFLSKHLDNKFFIVRPILQLNRIIKQKSKSNLKPCKPSSIYTCDMHLAHKSWNPIHNTKIHGYKFYTLKLLIYL